MKKNQIDMKGLFKTILIVFGLLILFPLIRLLIAVVSWSVGSLGLSGGVDPWFVLTIVLVIIFILLLIKLIND